MAATRPDAPRRKRKEGTFVSKRGRPTPQQAAAIADTILFAAKTLFLSEGYANTAMESVAALAQVSKGTLYARYPTKSDLLKAVVQERIATWSGEWPLKEMLSQQDIGDRLFERAVQMLAAMRNAEVRAFDHLVTCEAGRFPEIGASFYEIGYLTNVRSLTNEISFAGRTNGDPTKDAGSVALLFHNSLVGWLRTEEVVRDVSEADCREHALRIVSLVMSCRDAW